MHKEHIGGYMGLDIASIPPCENSILSVWTNTKKMICAHNARSAMNILIKNRKIKRVFIPAYTCDVLNAITKDCPVDIEYYSVGMRLDPDLHFITSLDSSSAVIINTYFGHPVSHETEQYILHSNALCIIDNSQTLDPVRTLEQCPVVYSPRKLLGVSDGGILVLPKSLAGRISTSSINTHIYQPTIHDYTLARLEDPDRTTDQYKMYSDMEENMAASSANMSKLSLLLLERIPYGPVREQRQRNWRTLFTHLAEFCLWNEPSPSWTPAGFPILTDKQTPLRKFLQSHGIYCAIHWPQLPAPETAQFAADYELSQNLLTLPCDQRYTDEDMLHIAKTLKKFVS